MKIDKKVYLAAIRRELQERYQYASREKRNHAFEVLYHGWRQKGIRHGRNYQHFVEVMKRGWVSKLEAEDLRKYIGLC